MYVNTLISLQENISTYGIDGRKVTGHLTICSPGIIKCYVQNLRRSDLAGKKLCCYVFSSKHTKGFKLGALSEEKESRWTVDGKNVMGSSLKLDEIDGAAIVAEGEDINSTDTILLGYQNNRYMIFPILEELLPVKRKYTESKEINTPDIVTTSPAAVGKQQAETSKKSVQVPIMQENQHKKKEIIEEEPEEVEEEMIGEEPEEVEEEIIEEEPEEVEEEIVEKEPEEVEEEIEEEPEEVEEKIIEEEPEDKLICKSKKSGKCSTVICTQQEKMKPQVSKCNQKCSHSGKHERLEDEKLCCECDDSSSSEVPEGPGPVIIPSNGMTGPMNQGETIVEQEPGPVVAIDGEPIDEQLQQEQESEDISGKPISPAINTIASSGVPGASVVTYNRTKPMVQREVEESYLNRQRQLKIEEEIRNIKERLCNLEKSSIRQLNEANSNQDISENQRTEKDEEKIVKGQEILDMQEKVEEVNYLQEIERKLKDIKEKLKNSNVLEKSMRTYMREEEKPLTRMKSEKTESNSEITLGLIYNTGEATSVMQGSEEVDWVKIPYAEFLKIPSLSYEWCTQPFVTFSFYKYNEILLGRNNKKGKYYVGIPDVYHPSRKNILDTNNKVQGFLCKKKKEAEIGEYGYWIVEV